MTHSLTDVVALQLRRGTTTSAELQGRFGLSQPVVSRILTELQRTGRALPFGRARATRYAAPREVAGKTSFPIARVDASGAVHGFGTLRGIAPGAYLFTDPAGGHEVFGGLPWFIADMRPQGFLGRAFPGQHPDLDLPRRITDWSDDQVMIALASRGEDCIGDLILGDEALRRHLQRPATDLPSSGVAGRYEALAEAALAGAPSGSSAGGEQPKFATSLRTSADGRRHVLVKFTERRGSPANDRLWDLLICENIALDVLHDSSLGLEVPRHRLLRGPRRLFLEIERFDRTNAGRRGVASLQALDAHFVGNMTTWSESAVRLQERRLITTEDVRRIADLETFGRLIGNTDMHYGNLSFYRRDAPDARSFALAPVYDQLPMLYAPVSGEVVDRRLEDTNLAPSAESLPDFGAIVALAIDFWNRVAGEESVSSSFRAIAASNAERVGEMARFV